MAAKEPNDIQDEIDPVSRGRSAGSGDIDMQFKKRARRRLVGAIALALFAIIVLPVVMDRQPAPTAPEIQVRIPNPDSSGLVGKAATKITPEKPTTASDVGNTPLRKDVPTAEPVEPASTNVNPGATTTAVKEPKTAPPNKIEEKSAVESSPPVKTSEVKESLPSTSGKWEVQLGAYQNAGNVALLMSKLKELKVPAYTEKFDTPQGVRTRVRAGPFPTKEAALAAQKRVRIIGVEGPVAPSSK